jgi:hypothetical protein
VHRTRSSSARRAAVIRLITALLGVALAAPPVRAQREGPVATQDVFRRHADRVVKIHVVETRSAAKAELGSGFFVTPDGHVVTNYHVISKVVHEPDRYRAEWIEEGATPHPLRILAVDVVHDLAVLRADVPNAAYFSLRSVRIAKGERLYALGHPNDLGLSIVEGTYNGLLQHTLYPKIHFTGAMNSGMSGGPAIMGDGRVVGVNVSTAGNGIGFLVPIDRAVALVERVRAPGFVPPTSFLTDIGAQLHDYQDTYLSNLLTDSTPTVTLGRYRLPTRPASFFKCWADAYRQDAERPYEVISHQCSTDDYVYLSADQSTGILEMTHRRYSSTELNAFRFFSLLQQRFAAGAESMDGSEEDVTRFRCETRNVSHDATTMRAVLCIRRYRKFTGLYDAVLKVATLGGRTEGLITTLTLSGVSYENAERIAERYLQHIATVRPEATR